MLSMNYPLIRVQEIAGGTPGTKGRRSGRYHALRFAMALLPLARRLPMSTRFKRLWTLGLLGAWLSIFSGNAFAACSVLLGGTGTDGTVSSKGCYTTTPPPPNYPPIVSITSPANNASFTPPANVSVTASAVDVDDAVAKVDFFDGATLVGTVTVFPYSVALVNLATGTHTFTARATDTQGASTTSTAVSIIVDTPPTVTITGPANNVVFAAPATITVTATASDADGTIAKVDFFDGATLVGTATAAPFGMTLANVAAGVHTLTTRATDNLGLSTTSAAVSVQVDTLPTVSITAPANNAGFTAPATITVTATASDADGTVTKVDFFDGATLVGTTTVAPFGVNLVNVAAGTHTLTARATDNLGLSTTSAAVSIQVNAPPTVGITAPANNVVFAAPATITMTATASDADGTIAKVDFFDGTTLAGTATAAPFGVTLANVVAGVHMLTARATDNLGASTTSAAVSAQVDALPTVGITSPANNAVIATPATISVTANATDSDGTVAKVDFFDGATLVGTATAAPFGVTLANVAAGAHTLTARATDNLGLSTTSAAVSIQVDVPPAVSITAPVNNVVFTASADITVTATASDADGTVAKVDFFDGATPVGTATATPYSVTLANVAAGTHMLTARAWDNLGLSATSAAVSIQVNAPAVVLNTSSVGATPGSFAVNQNGGATYTIPITAPPGTAGMAPKLALSYDKQVQNDLLGVGWSVSGLSLIQRCGRTIALDGLKGGVNYDANDRFCIDGQRLIAINNGVDGANGTEYRTEKESFSKIISYRDPPVVLFYVFGAPIYDPSTIGVGPQYFRVTTKSGTVMEYGVTADARIEVQGNLGTARLWALNKIQDTKGNYLTISYSEDNANGEYHPTRIAYTGNSGAGVAPYNSICFIYDNDPVTTPACDAPATTTRPDIVPRYEGGAVIKTTRRLSHIQTYAGAILARSYRLSYDNNGAVGGSRLLSVTECGSDGACLPGTTLMWELASVGFVNTINISPPQCVYNDTVPATRYCPPGATID